VYLPIWDAVREHLSAERMKADIAEFFEYSRWSSFDKLNGLARRIADKMEAEGMSDVRLIEFPADGRTAYGGWVMPQAYDVQAARLQVLNGQCRGVLADYRLNPTSLMLYSMPTPPEGVTAELVIADTLDAITSERVGGKMVLTRALGVEISQAAMRAGAHGLVSDCRNGSVFFKNCREVDTTNEWHNYTIPPWADSGKGFGFSISPERGRPLRADLETGGRVRVNAVVKSRHYDGVLPVISGCLKGEQPDEIVLTGHYDEYGADDNCSQIAVALEVCRAIKALAAAGKIPPLSRTIRILQPMEVRGFNALIQNGDEIRNIRAGLNIDTVGTDQNAATSSCTLSGSLAPSYADEFAAELLYRTSEINPLFRWRRTPPEMIDNIFGEPLIGAPIPQIWHFSATHHLETDKPATISGRMLTDMARVAATYTAFLANAALQEAIWLAELSAESGVRRASEIVRNSLIRSGNGKLSSGVQNQLASALMQYEKRPAGACQLVPAVSISPIVDESDTQRQHLVGESHLVPYAYFQARAGSLQLQVRQAFEDAEARMGSYVREILPTEITADQPQVYASQCVPLKLFKGFLGFEDLNRKDLAFVRDVLEIPAGWGAPMWLQRALMYANGKRTAGDIALLLEQHAVATVDVRRLERIFKFLAKQGAVRLRPYLTQAEIMAALQLAGVGRGDLLLGHFALSWFGYIEGGAESLIQTILELLGTDGTLVMPTFTFSWLGNMPYNPRNTPSVVGAVTNEFRKRAGVLRSAHPTHSFAAIGKHAQAITADHDHTRSPLSEDGPLGRIEALNGKILMFAKPESNTSMHLGEYRAGLPLLDFICPILQDGKRVEVVVPDCPWHVRFGPAYEKLYTGALIQEVPLGEQSIRVMRCADAIAAQAEVMLDTPVLLLQPGCDCAYCSRLKQHCTSIPATVS